MNKIWKEVKKYTDKVYPPKVEYIVCAAIRVIEEETKYPCVENKNLKIGLAHSDIINTNQYSDRKVYTQDGQKGFLTSELNFVFREEAAKIAYNAGQIKHKQGLLFTCDFDIKSAWDRFLQENPDKVELFNELRQ
jgi:hypothetical protein